MKAHRRMTASEHHEMEKEIKRQCVKINDEYEVDYLKMICFCLHDGFGFGVERLTKLLKMISRSRKQLKEWYKDELEPEYKMTDYQPKVINDYLLKYGIDVDKILLEDDEE